MFGWDCIEVENGRSFISEEVKVSNVYHCTNSFNISELHIGDIITLEARESFSGKGVYLSTREEKIYGNTVMFIEDEINATLIEDCNLYKWYRISTTDFIITNIIDNKIFLRRV